MFWEVYIYIDIYSLSGCFNPKRLTNEKDKSKSWRIYCSTQALIETFGSFDTPYSSWCCLFRYSEETDVYTLRSRDILIVDFVQLTVYYATPVPELIEGVPHFPTNWGCSPLQHYGLFCVGSWYIIPVKASVRVSVKLPPPCFTPNEVPFSSRL